MNICKHCNFQGDAGLFRTKNVCKKCKREQRKRNLENLSGSLITCKRCGFIGDGALFASKFVCKECYKKTNENYRSNFSGILKCKHCGFIGDSTEFTSKNICKKCNNGFGQKKSGYCPLGTNKKTALYLGVHIAEKVLSKIYKNVKIMPFGNPGFDFICGKGLKIDAKSSTLISNRSENPSWIFNIRRKKIPDLFLCLAFDNVNDLNP